MNDRGSILRKLRNNFLHCFRAFIVLDFAHETAHIEQSKHSVVEGLH